MLMNKYLNLSVRLTIFFMGLSVSASILFSNKSLPTHFFLVPIVYSGFILLLPSITKYMFKNIGLFAFNIGMIIRYLISPLLVSLEGATYSRSIIPSQESFNIATNLMLYEAVIIFFVFQFTYKKFYSIDLKKEEHIEGKKNIIGWLFIVLCFFLTFVYPEILSRYTFVFTAEELKSKALETDILSIIPLLFQLGILILTISLFNLIYKRYQKKNRYRYVIMGTILVLISSSFVIGTSRFSIILPLVTGLYMIFLLFKRYRKSTIIISIIAISFVLILSTALKSETLSSSNSSSGSFTSDLNDDLQLYFSGVNNVAIAVETNNIYPHFDFGSMSSDITRSVVLLNSFFKNDKSALTDFNITFYSGGLARDQILPMIGQGYLYFGFLLSPIFSVITLLLLMHFDSRVLKMESIFLRYIYAYISLKLGLFLMANFTILLSFLTNNFLILLILFKTNDFLVNNKKQKHGVKRGVI